MLFRIKQFSVAFCTQTGRPRGIITVTTTTTLRHIRIVRDTTTHRRTTTFLARGRKFTGSKRTDSTGEFFTFWRRGRDRKSFLPDGFRTENDANRPDLFPSGRPAVPPSSALLTRVVFHHVLVVPVRGRRQVHGRPERREQSTDVGRVQPGGGRAEFTDNGIGSEHHAGT